MPTNNDDKNGLFTRVWAGLRSILATEPAPAPPRLDPDDKAVTRRDLLLDGAIFFAKPVANAAVRKLENVNAALGGTNRLVPLLRPPGAIAERQFLQACTQCDACMEACPRGAIQKAPRGMGELVMGTPYIDPLKNPCVLCDSLACISVCEDGALLPVKNIFDIDMGHAVLDKGKCQAYGHSFCERCVVDCPVPGAITQVDGKPVFHENVCVGCGVCVHSCAAVSFPAAVQIKPRMVVENSQPQGSAP
ncbi:MAG: 4Fe-4S dicluster domain-containing protein [Nitrospinales bacterium]